MDRCPACSFILAEPLRDCPKCSLDLQPLHRFQDTVRRHFNDGIRAARDARWPEAVRWLGAACLLDPGDLVAANALAKAHACAGDLAEARRIFLEILKHSPHSLEANSGLQKVDSMLRDQVAACRSDEPR